MPPLFSAPSQAFLTSLSHEIRTPLHGVLGMARELGKTRLDAHQRELLRVLHDSGQHLLGVVDDVLDMARTSAGTPTANGTLSANGTVLTFTLPTAQASPVAAPGPASTNSGALAGLRVLLVEDNEINREVARFTLEEWGVVLDEAVDGEQGLHLLSHHDYDVALMDIQMPHLNGVEVTQAVRRLPHPVRARIPILALTANALGEDNERYRAAGMNDTLAKPFNGHELYAKLEALRRTHAPAAPYDLARLRALAHGRDGFVAKIIRSFLRHTPTSLAQLQAAAALGDWCQVAKIAHHLKPSLELLGVAGVAHPVAVLVQAPGPAQEGAGRAGGVAQFVALVEQALAAMPAELPKV